MGLFGKKDSKEEPLYHSSYLGFWINVYSNRVDFKDGVGSKSIPINQIASVQTPMMGVWKVILETAGGRKYSVPTNKKKEVQEAIYSAQSNYQSNSGNVQSSSADEIIKFKELKDKGVISEEEFEIKKKQLLGL